MSTRNSTKKTTGMIGAPDVDKAARKKSAVAAKKTQEQDEAKELQELEQKIKKLELHMEEKGIQF